MLKKQTAKVNIPGKVLRKSKIAIIRSKFNGSLTKSLEKGCLEVLFENGFKRDQVLIYSCPGSLEIPIVAQNIALKGEVDAIIALGVIVEGDTYHFELVANECARGCMDVSLKFNIPVIFEVLAVYDIKQAKKRAARDENNKGREAAAAACEILGTLSAIK